MSLKNIETTLNVSEQEQMSSHQNATLSGGPEGICLSFETHPEIPDYIQTQQDLKVYLESQLKGLAEDGWKFRISIGESIE